MTRLLAWGLWLGVVGSFAVVVATGATAEDGEGATAAFVVFVLAFATVGALVAARQPRNAIGWILLNASLAYAIGGLTVTEVEDSGPASPLVAWISTWVWLAGIGPVATFALLLFPDGRLPSPRWRGFAWLTAAANALVISGLALEPGRFEGTSINNPLGLAAAPDLPKAMSVVGGVGLAIAIVGAIVSLAVRFRRARGVERAQLKWLNYAGALVGVTLAASFFVEAVLVRDVVEITNMVVSLALAAVPMAMGIAILRHRLYDIDVVIRRTVVYGVLTAALAGCYLGLVLPISLAVGESDLAIAASTLAVAALFRPLRSRIQALVDRRFFRSRYDTARTLAGFGARLRDEVELESVSGELRAVVAETMRPAHVSLWLREAR